MKELSYKSCVAHTAMLALTFWRHFEDWGCTLLKVIGKLMWCLWMLVGSVVMFFFILLVPALVVVSPLTGWVKYRREVRRHRRGQ